MNSRISTAGRLAPAAMLTVLPASTVLAQANNLSVLGSLGGHGFGAVQGGALQATASGSGNASQIGRFTYALQATVDLAGGTSTGLFLLVFSNGEVINGSFSGQGGPTSTPNVGRIVERLTINGGTGRFQGATGSLTLDRLVDQTTLPAFESHSGTLTGTISTPGPTK